MSKRIISIFILLTLLLTGCSSSVEQQENVNTGANGEVYDLPDNEGAQTGDRVEPDSEHQNGANGSASDTEELTPEQTDSYGTTDEEPQQSSGTTEGYIDRTESNEPFQSSEAYEPTETQPVVKDVAPEQLAAVTLYALSMEYPDFVLQGFYAAGKGIYAMFETAGSNVTAYIYPIAGERLEPGTMDLFSNETGFAAFDIVEGADDNYTEIPEDAYVAMLGGLSGITVYSH